MVGPLDLGSIVPASNPTGPDIWSWEGQLLFTHNPDSTQIKMTTQPQTVNVPIKMIDLKPNRRLPRVVLGNLRSMPREGFYVDNAMNRSLGRVGMAYGTAVHSSGSGGGGGFSMSCERTYVDNAMNRSLDRVGMAYGTAVHSSSSGGSGGFRYDSAPSCSSSQSSAKSGKTYVDNAQNRSLGRVGLPHGTAVHSKHGGASSSSSSQSSAKSGKTYVDNAQNRSLGRVGLPHGTAVHSKHGSASSSSSSQSSAKSGKTYADNSQNRSLGPHGTAVHSKYDSLSSSSSSKSSASSGKTYADNSQNRSLGRVGLPHGTAVHSNSSSSSSSQSSAKPGKTYTDNALNRFLGLPHGTAVHSKGERKVYKDNAFNRKLNRVGLPLGTKPFHKNVNKKDSAVEEAAAALSAEKEVKVYKDNPFNRRHGRVGLPLGSKPISRNNEVYRENEINRRRGRVGQPWGSCPVDRPAQIYKHLEDQQIGIGDDLPDDVGEMYECASPHVRDQIEYITEFHGREQAVTEWLDKADNVNWHPHQRTSERMIKKCKNKIINFEDLILIQKVGHGGFGEVYMAEYNEELVAVKKLYTEKITKRHKQKFMEEVRVFCSLCHENVVRFIGVCTEAPNLAIVMEIMDMSLYDAIHIKEVDIDNDSTKKVVQDMTSGLAYLHSVPVAHCDMKSQNVLLNNIPGQERTDPDYPILAKITDFGLSKMKSNTDTTTSHVSGMRATPKYAAPEVLRGEILGMTEFMAADVYSLGLVIYELAVQEIPFEDLSLTQMIEQVGKKGLSPMANCDLNLNPYVKTKLNECFSFEAHKRPSAQEMVLVARNMTSLLNEEEE